MAIGDSTTEGLDDPDGHGGYRGWANRLAEKIAAVQGELLYANLAIRGRLTAEIRREQLDVAVGMAPDLCTVVSGVNDLLRPRFETRALAADLGEMFGALRARGATVLTFTMPDLARVMPIARALRGRVEALNEIVRTQAARTGARVVDLARVPVAGDPRLWSDDRLHANSLGHARIAEALAEAVELPNADPRWREPLTAAPRRGMRDVLEAELAWTRIHLGPWVLRHLRGGASGAGRTAKRPTLEPIRPT